VSFLAMGVLQPEANCEMKNANFSKACSLNGELSAEAKAIGYQKRMADDLRDDQDCSLIFISISSSSFSYSTSTLMGS